MLNTCFDFSSSITEEKKQEKAWKVFCHATKHVWITAECWLALLNFGRKRGRKSFIKNLVQRISNGTIVIMLARDSVKVLELPSSGDSISICFVNCCFLPHTDISREHSVSAEWGHGGENVIEQRFQLRHSLLWHAADCLLHRDLRVLWSGLDWN